MSTSLFGQNFVERASKAVGDAYAGRVEAFGQDVEGGQTGEQPGVGGSQEQEGEDRDERQQQALTISHGL